MLTTRQPHWTSWSRAKNICAASFILHLKRHEFYAFYNGKLIAHARGYANLMEAIAHKIERGEL